MSRAHIVYLLCLVPAASMAQGSMELDRRNLHLHTESPMPDFVTITGDGGPIGGISMIDGKQTALFNSDGDFIGGNGRFEYRASTPTGLYMDFVFRMGRDPRTHGGIYVSDMIVRFHSRKLAKGALEITGVVIDAIKLSGSKFEWATEGKDKSTQTGSTKVLNYKIVNGRLRFQLAALHGSPRNHWFTAKLEDPLKGALLKN